MWRALLFGLLVFELGVAQPPDTLWTRVLADSIRGWNGHLDLLSSGEYAITVRDTSSQGDSRILVRMTSQGTIVDVRRVRFPRSINDVRVLSNGNFLTAAYQIYIADSLGNFTDSIDCPSVSGSRQLVRSPHSFIAILSGEYQYDHDGHMHTVYLDGGMELSFDGVPVSEIISRSEYPWYGFEPSRATDSQPGQMIFTGSPRYYSDEAFVWVASEWAESFTPSIQGYVNGRVDATHIPGGGIMVAVGVSWGGQRDPVVRLYRYSDAGDTLYSRDFVANADLQEILTLSDGSILLIVKQTIEASQVTKLYKIDENANVYWTGSLALSEDFQLSEFYLEPSGECILIGSTASNEYPRVIIAKIGSVLAAPNLSLPVALECQLHPAYPNPFNPTTEIRFELARAGHTKLTVFDLMSREVAVLLDESLSAGSYAKTFDGSAFASGVYLYRLETGDVSETKKMVLLK